MTSKKSSAATAVAFASPPGPQAAADVTEAAKPVTERFIALRPEQGSPQMFPVARVGQTGLTALVLRQGETRPVVADDSPEPGVSETLARSLVERGLCEYCAPPAE